MKQKATAQKTKRRKIKVHVYEGVRIRQISDTRFMIDHRRGGVVTRKSYSTLGEAQTAASEIRTRQLNEGILGFSLSQDERRDAEKGKLLLDGRTSIEAACRFWLKHHPDTSAESVQRTMVKRLRAMRAAVAGGRMSAGSYKSCRTYYRAILKRFWNRKTTTITDDEITAFADSLAMYSDVTRHNIRGALLTLIKFHSTGRLAYKKNTEDKPPETFTIEQVKMMFAKAEQSLPEIIPALVMWFFCGMRPGEVEKLSSAYVNIKDKLVTIDAATSKRRWWRNVTIPYAGVKWLKRYPSGEMIAPTPSALRTWREKLMTLCGMASWPSDAPRHTFGTAHYNKRKDVKLTMYLMGHFGSPETFLRHYKGFMTEKDARAYFNILPAVSSARIIQMPRAKTRVA